MRTTPPQVLLLPLLLLLLVSSLKANPLSQCTERDVCEAIVFNQMALTALQEEMRGLMIAYNVTQNVMIVDKSMDLLSCQNQNQELKGQKADLERKIVEIASMDDQPQDVEKESFLGRVENLEKEKEDLTLALEDLTRFKETMEKTVEDLNGEKEHLLLTIAKQDERIQNLSILSYKPVDCADIQVQGQTGSGVYTIYPYQNDMSIEVLCDLDSDAGGWTVFFTRQPQDEPLDFNESWEDFKNGFGNINTEFWLGNDLLHVLTSNGALSSSTMRVDGESFSGDRRWAEWNEFQVADEEHKYQLTLDQYDERSTLGDSLSANTNSPFTTYDSDNDFQKDVNCALGSEYAYWGKGGWWYKACGSARPTAPLKESNYWDSACWLNWDPETKGVTSIKTLSMKFRRQNFDQLASSSSK